MVSVSSSGSTLPTVFTAVPETVTVLFAASVLLSTAVTVTVPVLTVAPAAMVSVLFALRPKSPDTAGLTAAAATVTVVVALDGWFNVAVTVLTCWSPNVPVSSDSRIEVGESASVTVGAASSSRMVSVTSSGAVMPTAFAAVAVTDTSLFGASVLLSTAVIVTGPVLAVAPAAMVSTPERDTVNAPANGATVTVVCALDG